MNELFWLLLLLIACAPAQEPAQEIVQPEELVPTVVEPVSAPVVAPEPKIQPKVQVEQIPAEPISEGVDKCFQLGCRLGSVLVGDMKTDLYYGCHCTFSKWIKPADLLCFRSEAEAQESGFRKAQSC